MYTKFSTKFSKIWVDLSHRLDRGQREHAGAAHGGARASDGLLPSDRASGLRASPFGPPIRQPHGRTHWHRRNPLAVRWTATLRAEPFGSPLGPPHWSLILSFASVCFPLFPFVSTCFLPAFHQIRFTTGFPYWPCPAGSQTNRYIEFSIYP